MPGESRVDRHWFLALVGLTLLVQGLSVWRAFSRPGRPALNVDSAFFQHAGWYVTQGAVPYADIWDIKPPLTIETTAVLSVLAGGAPFTHHLLSVAVTGGAAVGCSLLVGVLAYHLTEDAWASLGAGLVLLTVPGFYYLSANGFRPKYLTLCLGLAALALQLRDHPLLAGIAAAASAGYWQYGAIFALLVLGLAFERRDRATPAYALVGMAAVTMLVVLPVTVRGATVPMLVEVLYVPLTTRDAQTLLQRLGKLLFYLAYALVPAVLGAYGLATNRDRLPERWWVYVGVGWGALQVLLDLDSAPDLYLLVVFLALGVALFVADADSRTRQRLIAGLLGIALLNTLWVGGIVQNPTGQGTGATDATDTESGFDIGRLAESVDVSRPGNPPRHGIPPVRTLYWNNRVPPSCHYRLSETERDWLSSTGRPYVDSACGSTDGLP